MLSAYNRHEEDVIAWEVTREQGPFFCPECKEPVVVKKGRFKMHHFAHLPDSRCTYGVGESEQHWQAKYEIYEALHQHPSVSKLKVERYLKDVRPDVSFCWQEEHDVAVEMQISAISPDEVARRTSSYTAKNMSVLWITPYHDGMHSFIPYRTRLLERYFHALYFGKIYYWLAGEELLPVRFKPYATGTIVKDWYDENEQKFRFNVFNQFSPTVRNLQLDDIVCITDMKTIWRPARRAGQFMLPKARLWSL